jgi:hypothetical protein
LLSLQDLYTPVVSLGVDIHKRSEKMKKILVAIVVMVIGLGLFTGVAAARSFQVQAQQTGVLHDYMEQALADKLNLPLATVEAEFNAGKTLYQIALDNGIAQADLPAFMLEVRTLALEAAVADGVITQAQADRMAQRGYGMGGGMMNGQGGGRGGRGMQGGGMLRNGSCLQQVTP